MTEISLIWAQASNGVIGANGGIPWHLPEDLRRFRDLTHGKPVIMGRKTWESLPERQRPLRDRRNIVVSGNPDFTPAGAEVYPSLQSAMRHLTEAEVFVIGGARLYEAALPFADRLYLTEVEAQPDGDTVAPRIDTTWWIETEPEAVEWLTSDTGLRYRYVNYRAASAQVIS